MSRYEIRSLTSDDFPALARLETDVFGALGEATLCPHYLRLCTEIVSKIDRATLDRLRDKYERLGFVPRRPVAEAA